MESAVLFDCQVRVWHGKEIKSLQKFMDGVYRYIWSRKIKPPLMQMQEERKNMEDVRSELGVKSLRWKIERRVLERIGHVMRMDDGRMTKAVVLGWMEELERWDKPKGRRKKTVPYWKRLLREAGLDWTDVGNLTKDRKKWKSAVKERMEWLAKWERSKGKNWDGEVMERNQVKEVETAASYICDICAKVCRSKGGYVNHRRRMHEESALKKKFGCGKCGMVFKQDANLMNHEKICLASGEVEVGAIGGNRRMCVCGKDFAKSYYARHKKRCQVEGEVVEEEQQPRVARVYKSKRAVCSGCGKELSATNMAKHKREACPGQ